MISCVGFTGTRRGMIQPQRASMRQVLTEFPTQTFRHGDCVGADAQAQAQAHDMMRELFPLTSIAVHPPKIAVNRAFKQGNIIHEPKDYLERNKDIIDQSEMLIAAPKGMSEDFRGSGTWHAIRYARSLKRLVIIVWPIGRVESLDG